MSKAIVPYRSLSFFYFSYFAFLGAWIPYWTLYLERELAYSALEISQIMALSTLARVVGPYFWGLLSDVKGQRLRFIRLGAVCSFLSFCGIFFTHSFAAIAFIIFVYSFFWNAILSQFEALALNFLGDRAHHYSRIRLWGSVGFIIFVALLGSLFEIFSLSTLPYILTLILASIVLASYLVPIEQASELSENTIQSEKTDTRSSLSAFLTVLRQPSIAIVFLIFFLQQLAFAPYYTFFSIFLSNYEYSSMAIGWYWAIGVIAEVVLFAYMHQLLKRYSLLSLLQWSLFITSVRWLLTVYFSKNMLVLFFLQLLHAVSFAALHSIAMEWLRLSFPKHLHGQAQAFYSATAYGLGGVIGALLSGYVWGYWQGGVFYIAAIATFIAALLSLNIKNLLPGNKI